MSHVDAWAGGWFTVELRTPKGMVLTEEALRRDLLALSLPLLRAPTAVVHDLPGEEMLVCVDSADAHIDLRVRRDGLSMTVHTIGDAKAALRFCEYVHAMHGDLGVGSHRTWPMPNGPAGQPFESVDAGYLFGRVLLRRQSPHQTITLVEHPVYGRSLLLNDEIQFGADDERDYSGTLVAHGLPPDARRVLIIGGGDCGVLREVLARPVERAVLVELDEEVFRFCSEHFPSVVAAAPRDPRAEILFADAFEYLARCDERFDVVFSDLPDAPISGHSVDEQVALMTRVLRDDGTLASHVPHLALQDPTHLAEPMVAAIARRFEAVETVQRRIAAYQDQTWLFVRGRRPSR